MDKDKRIVITGLGVISPIGNKKDLFWDALISGTSGVSEITSFDTSPFRVHKGCTVKDFNLMTIQRMVQIMRLVKVHNLP